MTYDLTYLSFGAGVQSTALLVCSNLGLHGVPRADVAIFADTGYEPAYVYEQVDRMRAWSGIPVEIVKPHRAATATRFIGVPTFTRNADGSEGMGRRQCTNEWKLRPIERRLRQILGYKPRQRVKKSVRALIGISVDEAHRMKPSLTAWIEKAHPLVDARLRRDDCVRVVTGAGLPRPERSACSFCPFHSAAEWRNLRDNHPADWAKAVAYDALLRDGTSPLKEPSFVHRQRVPLTQVQLDRPERPMFANCREVTAEELFAEAEADAFGNECEGMCGV